MNNGCNRILVADEAMPWLVDRFQLRGQGVTVDITSKFTDADKLIANNKPALLVVDPHGVNGVDNISELLPGFMLNARANGIRVVVASEYTESELKDLYNLMSGSHYDGYYRKPTSLLNMADYN
ncbi:MAG: hypothetical protein ABIJ08_02570 [Nanoarchaeota archaeon]